MFYPGEVELGFNEAFIVPPAAGGVQGDGRESR